ncbi:hypothetical protein I551_3381 [Mycobacterium ulcerans str. Harvey]|uniref:Uncharacterized protein n=1 Tax=Mycobacterium ulcerans str. Harvey TaxID=1299332 RepID=A0ABP3AK00_MYCUL|nr:hypothetical protein I551_3381 [Mycobacterium ulcerans str. Harvey]
MKQGLDDGGNSLLQGRPDCSGFDNANIDPARRSAVRCSTAAQKPSTSPNWYCTAPQVAPIALAMRLAETEPGSPEASDVSAASSMLSRVALPRRLGRLPATPARVMCRWYRLSRWQ